MTEEFGPYRLEHLIGRGGMGEVHRAYDTARGRTVALKRLPVSLANDPEYQARFRRESALAAQLSEPHIIPIHDFGEIDGRLYIDMRLVEGVDLASVVTTEGPMAPRRAVGILAQVGGALDAAHAAGLVHRDVKPSNVLVRGHDEDEFAYLIDFGIARAASGMTSGPAITLTGATLGTLDYMAPERFENRPVDGRADVYSLACMLFELLTRVAPFHGRTPIGMIHAHTSLDPPRPSAHRAGLPQGLDGVVQRGMAKRPEQRYPTAGALVAAARAVLRGSPTHTAASPIPAPRAAGPHTPGAHTPPSRTANAHTPPPRTASPLTPPSRTASSHTPVPRTSGLHAPAPHTAGPHTAGPHTPALHTSGPYAPAPPTHGPRAAQPQTAMPQAPIPQAQAPLNLQKKAPPLSLRKSRSDRSPAPAAAGWRTPPPAPPRAPAPWSPPAHPARPGGMVLALVLQLVSGGIFLLGSLASVIGGVPLALVLMLVSAVYIGCAIKAFGGRRWARTTLAVINGIFGVFCLVVVPFGLTDTSSTAGEKVGGVFVLLLLVGVAAACTLPMFTTRAKAYVAALRPHS